jgi:hypothetical protein
MTVVVPFWNTAPLTPPLKWLATAPPQLSDAVGVAYATDALHWFKSLARTIFAGQIMVGAVASATVTIAEHVAVLLEPSLTVSTTVLVPKFAQVKALGNTDTWFTVPQLSDPLWNTFAVVMLAAPAVLRLVVKFLQITVGAIASTMVTVAEQVAVLLLPSLTVKTTVFAPKFAQVKVFGVTPTWFTVPQLSDPLWNTLPVVILAAPAALRLVVKFLQITVGAVASTMVTVAEQVAVLLLPSLTVKTTEFVPKFAQVKALGNTDTGFTVPQLSDPPWNTLLVVILAAPAALRLVVKFLQITVGAVASEMVTVNVQAVLFPPASVTLQATFVIPNGKLEPLAVPAGLVRVSV